MFAFTNSAEKISPTIIGAGVEVVGDIKSESIVQVHGIVRGKITADTVIIGKGGKVVGRVDTENLFLHGALEGPAKVNIANIFSNAQMSGTLSYTKLNINNNDGLECKLVCRKADGCDIKV